MSNRDSTTTTFFQGEIEAVNSDFLTFSLTNRSSKRLAVLAWNIPAIYGDLDRDLFRVHQLGAPMRYTGPIVEYSPASDKNVLTLDPGQTITTSVPIRENYALKDQQSCIVLYDSYLQFSLLHAGSRPMKIDDLNKIERVTSNEIELPSKP